MPEKPPARDLTDEIIEGYRKLVEVRYHYEIMYSSLQLPATITPEIVNSVRNYFLNFIYPPPEKRRQLETAFFSLSRYMTQPSKMWRLMGNMTAAVFKFGRHFPAAVKAGIVSLESYLEANKFEKRMIDAARQLHFLPPLSIEQIEKCIAAIPRKSTEVFLETVRSLFTSLTNENLLVKTIDILRSVIHKMEKYPDIYPHADVEGIQLGISIIESGYRVFHSYPLDVRLQVVDYVLRNEYAYLDHIYGKK